jgi:hypothetical protein
MSANKDLQDNKVTSSYREMQVYKQFNLGGWDLNQEVVLITKVSLEEQTNNHLE